MHFTFVRWPSQQTFVGGCPTWRILFAWVSCFPEQKCISSLYFYFFDLWLVPFLTTGLNSPCPVTAACLCHCQCWCVRVCAQIGEDEGESSEEIKPGYNIIKHLQLKTLQNSGFKQLLPARRASLLLPAMWWIVISPWFTHNVVFTASHRKQGNFS